MSLSDSLNLLRDYADRGDEAAFRELVSRYIDLVYSTAVRRVGGNAELARDVTQTVFTDIARKAKVLRDVELLGGWLHRHTGFVAATMIRAERRRQAREQEAAKMNALEDSPDALWQQLAPVLDETIDALEAADRKAILLRFFERRDFQFIGAALGISDDAAQKRVSRALEKLRSLLANRGVTLSVALLATLMAGKAVSAAPAGIASEVAAIALAGAASGAGVAVLLAKLAGSFGVKLAVGATVVGTAALLLWPQLSNSRRGPARQGNTAAASANTDSVQNAAASISNVPMAVASTTAAAAIDTSNKLVLTIVAADANKPVPDVQFDYWVGHSGKLKREAALQANRLGICEVPIPVDTTELLLVSQSDGFADTRLDWRTDRGEKIPAQYTLRVARSVPISGKVVGPDGEPIADAQVGFNSQADPAMETRPQSDDFGWPFWITATTDAQGRWRIDRISEKAIRTAYGSASHPDYVGSQMLFVSRNAESKKQLLEGDFTFRLGAAVVVHGIVLSPNGQPVPGANVLVGHVGESGRRTTTTKEDGTFSVSGCKPGKNALTAEVQGYAATTLDVELKKNGEPFQITLQSGKVLKLRVVDSNGGPVAKANVWLDTFLRSGPATGMDERPTPVQVDFNRQTDAEGRLEWESAPNQDLNLDISATGYMRSGDVTVRPDGEEHLITLTPALTISGTVSDATSGEPIPRFRVIAGWPNRNLGNNSTNFVWSTIDRFWLSFDGGTFQHTYEEPVIGGRPDVEFVFKFEADGYAPYISRMVKAEEGKIQFDIALHRAGSTEVTVLLPDGRPAPGADVGLASPGARVQVVPGGLSRDNPQSGGSLLFADEHGRFNLLKDTSILRVIAANAQGFAEATPTELAAQPVLQMQPWGRLEGTYLSGGKPVAGRELFFEYGNSDFETASSDFTAYRTKTDEAGRFVFVKVPPGNHKLVRVMTDKVSGTSSWSSDHPLMNVTIRPGETNSVAIGGSSYSVVARLKWPIGMETQTNGNIMAVLHTTLPSNPPPNAVNDPQALAAWREQPEIKAALSSMREFTLTKNADDSWAADDVQPGNYSLSVVALIPVAQNKMPKMVARAEVSVTVPAEPATGVINLGEIPLEPLKTP